jgi:hypothetical protein
MAVWAEFEEKEFETLANASFVQHQVRTGSAVRLFSPGQALEKDLGYDFATRIDPRSPLYRLLFGAVPGAVGIPSGARAGLRIPVSRTTRSLNVFLQYKRPESFAPGHRSMVWPSGQAHLGFLVREQAKGSGSRYRQIGLLYQLEVSLAGLARVHYACPSVWQKNDLYDRFAAGTLLASTVFVKPSQLARTPAPTFHVRWTFDPTRPSIGIPNPDGEPVLALDGVSFLEEVEAETSRTQTPRAFRDVISDLASRTGEARLMLEGYRNARPKVDRERLAREEALTRRLLSEFDGTDREAVESTLDVALMAKVAGLNWMVADKA